MHASANSPEFGTASLYYFLVQRVPRYLGTLHCFLLHLVQPKVWRNMPCVTTYIHVVTQYAIQLSAAFNGRGGPAACTVKSKLEQRN